MYKLAKKIKRIFKSEAKIEKGKNTPGSPPRRIPNIKSYLSINKKIKFTNLSEGLIRTINWYNKNISI